MQIVMGVLPVLIECCLKGCYQSRSPKQNFAQKSPMSNAQELIKWLTMEEKLKGWKKIVKPHA
jgi:hypothetical protein